MSTVVDIADLRRHYHGVDALDGASFAVQEHAVHGLLGRNGAGKTTLLRIIAGHERPSSGAVRVFGADPYENDAVLERICFVREGQRYPDSYRVHHVLQAGALAYPGWDAAFAEELIDEFDLPRRRLVKKLSRGMLSAVGIVVGLASRAPLTCFDEPYLGLDAVARQRFYDRLLADVAEHPRTIILSTHLIDEVADLIEHVVLVDHGRVVLDDDADDLRGRAVMITGPGERVAQLVDGRPVLHREELGSFARVTLDGTLDAADRARAVDLGLDLQPVSLQQLVVRRTEGSGSDASFEEDL